MSGITIHGAVVIAAIKSREVTRVLNDTGTVEAGLSLSGMTRATLALAREYDRMLTELVWYQRHSGGLYISSDDHTIDSGLYELSDVRSRTIPDFTATAIFEVSLTLRRLGSSPLGGNVVQRLRAQNTLTANSYSITSTPRFGLPVGAQTLDVVASSTRTTEDGAVPVLATAPRYAFSGSGYNKGECKIFDTRGDATEANWQRVFSPDHTFSDHSHIVMQNGLIRVTGNSTASQLGRHRIYVWTGAAYTEVTGTDGDLAVVGVALSLALQTIEIDHLSPERVSVTFRSISGSSPFVGISKQITLYRGKPLGKWTLTSPSATSLLVGTGTGQWVFTKGSPLSGGDMQRPAFDDGVETGDLALNAPEDNWVACFTTKSSSTGTLTIGAWSNSGLTFVAQEGGGFYINNSSGTSMTVWLGGVKYDTSSAQLEAEAGTLTGGAFLAATVAGASGGGNNQVALNTIGHQLDITTNLASIGGSSAEIVFRIASETTNSALTCDLIIRNTTAGSNLATVTRNGAHFAATNTWYWQSVVGTGWNGTDALAARVVCNGASGASQFVVDQVIPVAIAGGAAEFFVDDLAAQALTESIVAAVTSRQVF